MKKTKDDGHTPTDEEFIKFSDDRIEEMPSDILKKAIDVLKEEISDDTKNKIRGDIRDNRLYWFAPLHFRWGMAIRNLLRDKVCLDDKLPSGNWDDYYVQVIEILVHARLHESWATLAEEQK